MSNYERLSKQQRFTVKVLLETRKRIRAVTSASIGERSEKMKDLEGFVQGVLNSFHEAPSAITPFSGFNFRENSASTSHPPCVLCGKGVESPTAPKVRVIAGGGRFATQLECGEGIDEAEDMGWWSVGPHCKRVLDRAGVYMLRHEE